MGLAPNQLRLATFATIVGATAIAAAADLPQRHLYAVNQSAANRGSISVYDIDAGHRLLQTIHTVPNVEDVRGVAGSAATGLLYVTYRDVSGNGMLYCLDVNRATGFGTRRSFLASIGWLAIRTDSSCMFRPGRVTPPITSRSWMARRAT